MPKNEHFGPASATALTLTISLGAPQEGESCAAESTKKHARARFL
jgi:hypothetical protein